MISYTQLIDRYLGVPYKHLGRSIEDGLDCWGIVIDAYALNGIELPDMDNYEFQWSKKGQNYFIENMCDDFELVAHPKYYDIILFENEKGVCNHTGIYLREGLFIQACKFGVIVTRLKDPRFKEKVQGIYRHKDMKWLHLR